MDVALIGPLLLAGYVPLVSHGFALPCFATGPKPNTWYIAVCAIDGDHASTIASFSQTDLDGIIKLDEALQRSCNTGSPWTDVFLWEGVSHVGTPQEIWEQTVSMRENLQQKAPVSLLDLAFAAAPDQVPALIQTCKTFLEKRFDQQQAEDWFRNTCVPHRVLIALRRALAGKNTSHVNPLANALSVTRNASGQIEIELSRRIADLVRQGESRQNFAEALIVISEQVGVGLVLSENEAIVDAKSLADKRVEGTTAQGDSPSGAITDGLDILILVAGARARVIARHLTQPEWQAPWLPEGVRHQLRPVRTMSGLRDHEQPQIYVVDSLRGLTSFANFGAVVAIVDDDIVSRNQPSGLFSTLLDHLETDPPAASLLIPALPATAPSQILLNADEYRAYLQPWERRRPRDGRVYGFNAMLDTANARSPFWAGPRRRSLERRVADLAVTASLCLLGDHAPIGKRLLQRPGYAKLVLSIQYGTGARVPTDVADSNRRLMSESAMVGSRQSTTSFETEGMQGLVGVSDHENFFSSFIDATLRDSSYNEFAFYGERKQRKVPPSISSLLRYPYLSYTIDGHLFGRALNGVIVTAEAPGTQCLFKASEEGWAVVRYTDEATLQSLLRGNAKPNSLNLPLEIALPVLSKLPDNKGLAIRGVDRRDVFTFDEQEFESWPIATQRALRSDVRRMKVSISDRPEQIRSEPSLALPLPVLRQTPGLSVKRLPGRIQEDGSRATPLKRPSDLYNCWRSAPEKFSRYVIADGVIPIRLCKLTDFEVPLQSMFKIDGDASVPVLLLSRIFAVWAQATMSRSTSWMPRFSISKTFESFPLAGGFMLSTDDEGAALLIMKDRYAQMHTAGRTVDEYLRKHGSIEATFETADRLLQSMLEEIDQVIAEQYKFNSSLSDVELLEALLQMNALAKVN